MNVENETVEVLRSMARQINDQLSEIDRKKKLAENTKLIGRYFKYRNSYGSGDKWWLYLRVDSVDSGGDLRTTVFETTSHDEISISQGVRSRLHGYIEIPATEYKRELRKLTKRILALK